MIVTQDEGPTPKAKQRLTTEENSVKIQSHVCQKKHIKPHANTLNYIQTHKIT